MISLLKTNKNVLSFLLIILAGELIFSLPFHIPRFFRPTLLKALNITNSQLGDMFAVYGVAAMLSYFPGGLIADRYESKKLIYLSLLFTMFGGLYLNSIPSVVGLYFLFAFWGFTTIFLFWAPMIKVTRALGSKQGQGLTFGILDGGRGLAASIAGSALVFILSFSVGDESLKTLKTIIVFYTVATFILFLCIYFLFDIDDSSVKSHKGIHFDFSILKNPKVFLLAGIIIAAYCGYKSLDNYGLYGAQILGMTDLASSRFMIKISYFRFFVAILAGYFADRFNITKSISLMFFVLIIVFIALAELSGNSRFSTLIILNLYLTGMLVFGLRGVYFAMLEEGKMSTAMTGTIVGIVSFIGYTPDIFFGSLVGRILDYGTIDLAFKNYFYLMAVISALGLICAILFKRHTKTNY